MTSTAARALALTTTPEHLDQVTVDLIFALRDSLTTVTRLDFWQGRITSALETAAAGSESWEQAITTAARKLQIDTLTATSAKTVTGLAALNISYEQWAGQVARNIVYIVALANVERANRKPKTTADPEPELNPTF